MTSSLRVMLLGLVLVPALAVARGRGPAHPGQNGPLTGPERDMAGVAWRYFEANLQPATCLVNAVDQYPSTTMWDVASYIGALVSAEALGVLSAPVFEARVGCLLNTLTTLPLFDGELPNKAYNTQTATRSDYANVPGDIGYSALDLGRLLIWLKILEERHPAFSPRIRAVLDRWSFCGLLDRCGTMYGAAPSPEGVLSLQEGRLGYEEYAAKGFQLWGFDTRAASREAPAELRRIYGVDVPHDARDPRLLGAHNYVVTESYALDGLELNWDRARDRRRDDLAHSDKGMAERAGRIYEAQAGRHAATGVLTARTEHQVDREPWFVYDTLYSDGYPWNTISDSGQYLPALAAVSTKAALSLWALWDTPYTELLFRSMAGQHDPERGFYEGVYEQSGERIQAITANTNGIILETLLYKVEGKILRFSPDRLPRWEGADPELARQRCQLAAYQRAECGPAPTR